jgi:hypothetical protein
VFWIEKPVPLGGNHARTGNVTDNLNFFAESDWASFSEGGDLYVVDVEFAVLPADRFKR